MAASALHAELLALAPEVLPRHSVHGGADGGPTPRAPTDLWFGPEIEAHVAAGCSPCARALYNARETAVSLAAHAPAAPPRAALRARLLRSAGPALSGRLGAPPRRFFDPAGELARLHVGTPEDEARSREVDDLGLTSPAVTPDPCEILLAQVQGLLGFPLLFISVIRGDRCGYRAQIGFPPGSARDRRRATTFCTHTVSGDAPLVIPDAAREPFFQGSAMVVREGIGAYAGVPLRTSSGIVVGTVCAMDYVARRIDPAVIRVLDLYARPIAAEIERARAGQAGWPRTSRGAFLHPEGWFRELSSVSPPAPPIALSVGPGPAAEALADLALPGEIVGRLPDDGVGLLLPLRHTSPAERLAALRAALGLGLSS